MPAGYIAWPDRAYGKLESRDEWIYFNNNVGMFQCAPGQSGEADNYSGIW